MPFMPIVNSTKKGRQWIKKKKVQQKKQYEKKFVFHSTTPRCYLLIGKYRDWLNGTEEVEVKKKLRNLEGRKLADFKMDQASSGN